MSDRAVLYARVSTRDTDTAASKLDVKLSYVVKLHRGKAIRL